MGGLPEHIRVDVELTTQDLSTAVNLARAFELHAHALWNAEPQQRSTPPRRGLCLVFQRRHLASDPPVPLSQADGTVGALPPGPLLQLRRLSFIVNSANDSSTLSPLTTSTMTCPRKWPPL